MTKRSFIGIDLGGTKTLVALFDDKFRVIDEVKFKTLPQKGEPRFTRQLIEATQHLVNQAKLQRRKLTGVGVGCAGFVDAEAGVPGGIAEYTLLKNYALGSRLRKITSAGVVIGNDVQFGIYGEHQLGAAVGCKHVLGVFLGTGVGGAMIIDGKLHKGASGAAGEIGHFLLQPIGPLAGSDRQGILDDVASRTAIAAEASALAAKQWAPHLFKAAGTDLARIQSRTLAEAIKKGDKAVEEVVRSRTRMVGIVLSNLVNFLSPEMVVIGGGLAEAMPRLILTELEAGMRQFLLPPVSKSVKVVLAKLKDHAVTSGAAKMAFDQFAPKAKQKRKAHP